MLVSQWRIGVRTLDKKWINNVMMDKFEIWMPNPMFNIPFSSGEMIVQSHDFMSLFHQTVHEMRTHKPRPSGHL